MSVRHLGVHIYIHSSALYIYIFIMAYQINIKTSMGGACGGQPHPPKGIKYHSPYIDTVYSGIGTFIKLAVFLYSVFSSCFKL